MALEDQTTQSKQSAAVVASMVHAFFQCRYHRIGGDCSKFGEYIARKLSFEKINNHAGQAFTGFQGHVTDKAVTHHNVSRPLENVIAFDIAIKVQVTRLAGSAQQFTGFFDDFVALD